MKQKPTGLDWAALKAPEPEEPKPNRQGRRIELTDDEIAEAVADYLRGEHTYDIARAYDVTPPTVAKWVRAAGHRIRAPHESRQLDRERRAES